MVVVLLMVLLLLVVAVFQSAPPPPTNPTGESRIQCASGIRSLSLSLLKSLSLLLSLRAFHRYTLTQLSSAIRTGRLCLLLAADRSRRV